MGSKAQLVALAVILQLLSLHPQCATPLGLDDSAYWAAVESRQASSQAQAQGSGGFKVSLTHFTQALANVSLTDRVRMAFERSHQRLAFFYSQTSKQSSFQTEATFTSPVYSNQGSYLMTLELGTPANKYVAIADTGSDLVWIQGLPCQQCFQQPSPLFDPSKSSSYQSTTCADALCAALPRKQCTTGCQYGYAYGDQSTTQGDFARDTITLTTSTGSSQSFPGFGFGVGHRNQGTFVDTDGLVGLGQGPLSLIGQLGSQFGNVFSYCLVDFYSPASKTSSLVLGSTGGALSYTPLVSNSANPTFYYVNVVGIDVGGTLLSYPAGTFSIDSSGSGGFILDSGTTVTQLPLAAYTALVNALSSLISYPTVDYSRFGFDLCYDLSAVTQPRVPSVTFKFENVDLELPGNNIFLQVDNAGSFCLAMQGSSFGLGIYGNVQQQNFEVVHDRAAKRVGFAPKQC